MELVTTTAGYEMLLRWGHLLAGVTWIGLLYYFNFVQGEYFKEADGGAKSDAIQKLVPRALWWFRWGAMAHCFDRIGNSGHTWRFRFARHLYRRLAWRDYVCQCLAGYLA